MPGRLEKRGALRSASLLLDARVTDAHRVSIDVDAADAAARTVMRLLAVGDIDIVWSMLHVD